MEPVGCMLRLVVGMAALGWGRGGAEAAMVDCMWQRRPVVSLTVMGGLLVGAVVLQSATTTAGLPLVRCQTAGVLSLVVGHTHTNALLAGVERHCGTVLFSTWQCRDYARIGEPERACLKGAGVQPRCRLHMLPCI